MKKRLSKVNNVWRRTLCFILEKCEKLCYYLTCIIVSSHQRLDVDRYLPLMRDLVCVFIFIYRRLDFDRYLPLMRALFEDKIR